ncbi:bifunctional DNA-binding transcriptional regulator/O6-methylguanine-DNA methyltransferase Ada [Sphingomonas profundi]|uniref:bifunctional DNA-binding transcriptional regulator/O6-methylguanine-DNA methyltransferase Ada n=1 Tax=Alterirhizorhabdus profundi TaxID=2681549 RepID=UPI0012E8FB21|nr:bifunctional DNA-binding transcriptional regulator/O6-methylguanine-DNA methyltransferase Ada [Sphingomonas profundi]
MNASRPVQTADDPRWARIRARDASADGAFWYSVLTTGVYCRPSCASRAANPANVTIHDSLAGARATGARPCRRCDPEGTGAAAMAARIVAACKTIETAEQPPALAALAAAAGLSPGYFHRLFKARTGLTPRDYAAAHRAARVREELRAADTVTEAINAAGFASHGRFYEGAAAMLGMTPTRYRAGGAAETLRFAVGQCALGAILVAASDKGIAAILIGDDPADLVEDLQDRFPAATLIGDDAGYQALVAQVIGFVEAPATGLDLPLDVRGTAFQQRVWQALRRIPAGRTASYAEIAAAIGAPSAVRAVAGACAANSHAVAIPCHRVVRTDGALSGYRWGVERKRRLLALEAAE